MTFRPLNVLIACESSGAVRRAFRALGHNAWSCDLLPADDGSERHLKQDALNVARFGNWHLIIAHPPCTYLCNSGVRWLSPGGVIEPHRHQQMKEGTPEQEAALEAAKVAAVDQALALPNPERYFYNMEKRELNPHTLGTVAGLSDSSYYSWSVHVLKQAGLYEVPLPAGQKCTGDFPPDVLNGSRGYHYGERWLYRELPESIVAELKAISIQVEAVA